MISGTSPDGRLVEFVELAREEHPFFVGTQAHPEFKSRPTRAHPLFAASSRPRSSGPTRRRPSSARSVAGRRSVGGDTDPAIRASS